MRPALALVSIRSRLCGDFDMPKRPATTRSQLSHVRRIFLHLHLAPGASLISQLPTATQRPLSAVVPDTRYREP